MVQAVYNFPAGFMWGTATSSHQVEGRNENNQWWVWEQQPERIKNGDRSGLACNWWGQRWREDFDRAAETGQNAHRLSLEWSRIQPTPDRWNEDAIDFYREMLRGLVDRGLTPMVTLHHFTDPIWMSENGGWENDEAPALFGSYTKKVVEALKEYCGLWVTINEPNIYTWGGYLGGGFPPGKTSLPSAFQVLSNLLRAHALAYRAIHEIQPSAQVGIAHHYRGFEPAHPGFPPDIWMANFLSGQLNSSFPRALVNGKLRFALRSADIPEAAGTQDFFGLNYYTGEAVAFSPLAKNDFFSRRFFPVGVELSPTGYLANRPEIFFKALKWSNQFDLPIYITENGIEDAGDNIRPHYLLQHIHQIWKVVNNNCPVKGYFHWSLIDNFEWERGWSQRFGLWGLDLETQTRIRRKSVDLYEAICKENAISSATTTRYAPEILPVLFPE